jgi:hypothetical protein
MSDFPFAQQAPSLASTPLKKPGSSLGIEIPIGAAPSGQSAAGMAMDTTSTPAASSKEVMEETLEESPYDYSRVISSVERKVESSDHLV